MRALISDNQASWDDYLSAIPLAFNCAKIRATNFSPNGLMFMRKPRIELDLPDNNRAPRQEEDEYINKSLKKMHKAFNLVENLIKNNLDSRLKEYSFFHRNQLEVGQHVLVFNPNRRVGEASKFK